MLLHGGGRVCQGGLTGVPFWLADCVRIRGCETVNLAHRPDHGTRSHIKVVGVAVKLDGETERGIAMRTSMEFPEIDYAVSIGDDAWLHIHLAASRLHWRSRVRQ
jgi:hypothetical protein